MQPRSFIHIILAFILIVTFSSFSYSQAKFTSKVISGNWNSKLSWTILGVDEDSIPDANDSVIISSTSTNRIIVIPIGVSAFCGHLVVGTEGQGTGGGITMEDSSSLQCLSLTVNRPSNGTRLVSINNGTVFVSGDVVLNSSSNATTRISRINLTNGTLFVKGNINYNANIASNAIVDLSNGTSSVILEGEFKLNPVGSFNSGTTGTIVFKGSNHQIIPLKQSSFLYNNIVIDKHSQSEVEIDSSITLNNVKGNIHVLSGSLDMGEYYIIGSASKIFELDNNTRLLIGKSNSINSFPIGFTPIIDKKSAVVYSGGEQTIASIPNGYGNLSLINNGKKVAGGSLSVHGDFYFESPFDASMFTHTFNSNWINNSSFFHSEGTVKLNSSTEIVIRGLQVTTFNNLVINSTSKVSLLKDINVDQNLSVESGVFDFSQFSCGGKLNSGIFSIRNNAKVIIADPKGLTKKFFSIITEPFSTIEYNGANQIISEIDYGNLILSGSGVKAIPEKLSIQGSFIFSTQVDAKQSNISVYGNWENDGGIFTSLGDVKFIGDGVSTITGTAATTFYNLISEKNSSLLLNSDISVKNLLTIDSGIFDAFSHSINEGKNFELNNKSTFRTSHQNFNLPFSSVAISPSSIFEYYGNEQQDILGLQYGNLHLLDGGTKNALGTILASNVEIENNVTFDGKNFFHTVSGDWVNRGAFISSGEITFSGNNQLITSSDFNNVTFAGAGIKTILGDINATGNISVEENVSLDGGSNSISVRGNWENRGEFVSSGTVILNGTKQVITSGSFKNVHAIGTGLKLCVGSIIFGGSLTIDNGVSIDAGEFTHHIAGNYLNEGIFSSTGNVVFNGDEQLISSGNFKNIYLKGSGNKTAIGNVVASNNFMVDPGVVFNGGIFAHSISGNFIVGGTFNSQSSTIILQGNTRQDISGVTYYNLVLNNHSGAKLLGNGFISNKFTSVDGNLFTQHFTLELLQSATVDETQGNSIIGTVTTLRNVNANELTSFGKIGIELLSPNEIPGPTLVTRITGVPIQASSTFEGNVSIRRYFRIIPTLNKNLNATVIMHYDDNEVGSQHENVFDVWNSENEGMSWRRFSSNTGRNVNDNSDTISGINSLGMFTLADSNNFLYGGTLKVKKFQDGDGNPFTTNDWVSSRWNLRLFRDSISGNLVSSSQNNAELTVTDLSKGIYSIVQSDSFGWVNLGYQVNDVFTQSTLPHFELQISPGFITVVNLASSILNSIVINSFYDGDGKIYTTTDKNRKPWHIELHKSLPNGELLCNSMCQGFKFIRRLIKIESLGTLNCTKVYQTENW